jgi:hypothetical protein
MGANPYSNALTYTLKFDRYSFDTLFFDFRGAIKFKAIKCFKKAHLIAYIAGNQLADCRC